MFALGTMGLDSIRLCESMLFVIDFLKDVGLSDEAIMKGLVGAMEEQIEAYKKLHPNYNSFDLLNDLRANFTPELKATLKEMRTRK